MAHSQVVLENSIMKKSCLQNLVMTGERTRPGGGNGLGNLENAVSVEMTVQQDLWLWVMELTYHQAQGQREGTWRINTPIALSSYSFILSSAIGLSSLPPIH